jgi:ABC-2 type transport system permease protein
VTRTLVFKVLRDLRWSLLAVGGLLAGFEMLWAKITERITVELIPEFTKLAPLKQIAGILFKGSGKLMQTMMGGETIRLDSTMDMLTIGYVHPLVQTVFGIWAIGRASGALAGEMDRGTMELLLAQPIARSRVVLAHFVVDLLTIPCLCLCLVLGSYVGVSIVRLDNIDLARFWRAVPNAAALIFALSGMTMAFSAAGRFRWRVLSLALGLALIQFVLNVVGQLWDLLAPWRALTVFYYYQPQPTILQDRWTVPVGKGLPGLGPEEALFSASPVAVLVLVGLVGYAIALAAFTRRDLPAPL